MWMEPVGAEIIGDLHQDHTAMSRARTVLCNNDLDHFLRTHGPGPTGRDSHCHLPCSHQQAQHILYLQIRQVEKYYTGI